MYSFHSSNPASTVSSSANPANPTRFSYSGPSQPIPRTRPPAVGGARKILSWPLDKYSFSDTSAAAINARPPTDIKWTHWPHRDGLFLVLDVPDVVDGIPTGSGIRMKVVCNVQTMHDLDLTTLIARNVMAEGHWQPAVFLLGRAPCLAVKYARERESYCQRLQVRFRKTEDFERVTEVLKEWKVPVKVRTQGERNTQDASAGGGPAQQPSMQVGSMDSAQFSQHQPQQSRHLYNQPYQYSQPSQQYQQINRDQYRAQQHYYQQQQLPTHSYPSNTPPFLQTTHQSFLRPQLNHHSFSAPDSVSSCRPSENLPLETLRPRAVTSSYHLPSPPGSSQSFHHPSLPPPAPPPLPPSPTFDPIDDLDEELPPPPRPPIAFSKGSVASSVSKAPLKPLSEMTPLMKPTPIPKPKNLFEYPTPPKISIPSGAEGQERLMNKIDDASQRPTKTKGKSPTTNNSESSSAPTVTTSPSTGDRQKPDNSATATAGAKKRKAKAAKQPVIKQRVNQASTSQTTVMSATVLASSGTKSGAAKKRRKVDALFVADKDDATVDEEEIGEIEATGAGDRAGERSADNGGDCDEEDDEFEWIQRMMVEALQDEGFVGFCEKVGEVWEKMGFVDLRK